jgi:hypothetical protein
MFVCLLELSIELSPWHRKMILEIQQLLISFRHPAWLGTWDWLWSRKPLREYTPISDFLIIWISSHWLIITGISLPFRCLDLELNGCTGVS